MTSSNGFELDLAVKTLEKRQRLFTNSKDKSSANNSKSQEILNSSNQRLTRAKYRNNILKNDLPVPETALIENRRSKVLSSSQPSVYYRKQRGVDIDDFIVKNESNSKSSSENRHAEESLDTYRVEKDEDEAKSIKSDTQSQDKVRSLSRESRNREENKKQHLHKIELEESNRRSHILEERHRRIEDTTERFLRSPLKKLNIKGIYSNPVKDGVNILSKSEPNFGDVENLGSASDAEEKSSNISVLSTLHSSTYSSRLRGVSNLSAEKIHSVSLEDVTNSSEQKKVYRPCYGKKFETKISSSSSEDVSLQKPIIENQKPYPTRTKKELLEFRRRHHCKKYERNASKLGTTQALAESFQLRDKGFVESRGRSSNMSSRDDKMFFMDKPKFDRRRSIPNLSNVSCINSVEVFETVTSLAEKHENSKLVLISPKSSTHSGTSESDKEFDQLLNKIGVKTTSSLDDIPHFSINRKHTVDVSVQTDSSKTKSSGSQNIIQGSDNADSVYYDSLEDDDSAQHCTDSQQKKKAFFVNIDGTLQKVNEIQTELPPRLSTRLETLTKRKVKNHTVRISNQSTSQLSSSDRDTDGDDLPMIIDKNKAMGETERNISGFTEKNIFPMVKTSFVSKLNKIATSSINSFNFTESTEESFGVANSNQSVDDNSLSYNSIPEEISEHNETYTLSSDQSPKNSLDVLSSFSNENNESSMDIEMNLENGNDPNVKDSESSAKMKHLTTEESVQNLKGKEDKKTIEGELRVRSFSAKSASSSIKENDVDTDDILSDKSSDRVTVIANNDRKNFVLNTGRSQELDSPIGSSETELDKDHNSSNGESKNIERYHTDKKDDDQNNPSGFNQCANVTTPDMNEEAEHPLNKVSSDFNNEEDIVKVHDNIHCLDIINGKHLSSFINGSKSERINDDTKQNESMFPENISEDTYEPTDELTKALVSLDGSICSTDESASSLLSTIEEEAEPSNSARSTSTISEGGSKTLDLCQSIESSDRFTSTESNDRQTSTNSTDVKNNICSTRENNDHVELPIDVNDPLKATNLSNQRMSINDSVITLNPEQGAAYDATLIDKPSEDDSLIECKRIIETDPLKNNDLKNIDETYTDIKIEMNLEKVNSTLSDTSTNSERKIVKDSGVEGDNITDNRLDTCSPISMKSIIDDSCEVMDYEKEISISCTNSNGRHNIENVSSTLKENKAELRAFSFSNDVIDDICSSICDDDTADITAEAHSVNVDYDENLLSSTTVQSTSPLEKFATVGEISKENSRNFDQNYETSQSLIKITNSTTSTLLRSNAIDKASPRIENDESKDTNEQFSNPFPQTIDSTQKAYNDPNTLTVSDFPEESRNLDTSIKIREKSVEYIITSETITNNLSSEQNIERSNSLKKNNSNNLIGKSRLHHSYISNRDGNSGESSSVGSHDNNQHHLTNSPSTDSGVMEMSSPLITNKNISILNEPPLQNFPVSSISRPKSAKNRIRSLSATSLRESVLSLKQNKKNEYTYKWIESNRIDVSDKTEESRLQNITVCKSTDFKCDLEKERDMRKLWEPLNPGIYNSLDSPKEDGLARCFSNSYGGFIAEEDEEQESDCNHSENNHCIESEDSESNNNDHNFHGTNRGQFSSEMMQTLQKRRNKRHRPQEFGIDSNNRKNYPAKLSSLDHSFITQSNRAIDCVHQQTQMKHSPIKERFQENIAREGEVMVQVIAGRKQPDVKVTATQQVNLVVQVGQQHLEDHFETRAMEMENCCGNHPNHSSRNNVHNRHMNSSHATPMDKSRHKPSKSDQSLQKPEKRSTSNKKNLKLASQRQVFNSLQTAISSSKGYSNQSRVSRTPSCNKNISSHSNNSNKEDRNAASSSDSKDFVFKQLNYSPESEIRNLMELRNRRNGSAWSYTSESESIMMEKEAKKYNNLLRSSTSSEEFDCSNFFITGNNVEKCFTSPSPKETKVKLYPKGNKGSTERSKSTTRKYSAEVRLEEQIRTSRNISAIRELFPSQQLS